MKVIQSISFHFILTPTCSHLTFNQKITHKDLLKMYISEMQLYKKAIHKYLQDLKCVLVNLSAPKLNMLPQKIIQTHW